MKIGSTDIEKMYLGGVEVAKAYLENVLAYEAGGGGSEPDPTPDPGHQLPEGYTECDYIQNTTDTSSTHARAYINVGEFGETGNTYKWKSNFRIVAKIQNDMSMADTDYPPLFGLRQSMTSGSAIRFEAYGYTGTPYEIGCSVGGSAFGTAYRTNTGQPHTIDLSQSRLIYDGITYPNTNASPWSWTSTMYFLNGGLNSLGASGLINGISRDPIICARGAKFYYFQIYDGDTLVRDYIPCYNETAQKYGLYDLVNNTFVSSASSVEFTGQIKQS